MSASAFNTLAHLDVENRRVLVRLDLDQDDAQRPQAPDSSLSTVKELLHRGARVILAGHRAARGADPKRPSLRRTGSRLAEALECPVQLPDEVIGDGVRKLIRDTRGGQVVLLENLDLDPREANNNAELGRQLAELCDVYVMDAVSGCLDPRASISQLAQRMPDATRGIGHRVERHLEAASVLSDPNLDEHTLIFGHDRVELLSLAGLAKLVELRAPRDPLVIGGVLGQRFAQLKGGEILADLAPELRTHLRAILDKIEARGLKLVLPLNIQSRPGPDPSKPEQEQLVWGEESRRDLISTLHLPRIHWLGTLQPSKGTADARWLGDRLAQHERGLLAVGSHALAGLQGHQAPPLESNNEDEAPRDWTQLLGLNFILSRLARAPMPGLEAVAVTEQNDA